MRPGSRLSSATVDPAVRGAHGGGRLCRLATSALVACGLLAAGPVPAVQERPLGPIQHSFELFGLDEGLESPAVRDLAIDPIGNLWIATRDGVVRYDGEQFVTYGERQGLPSIDSDELEIDGTGALWAGTGAGLARFSPAGFAGVDLPGASPGSRIRALTIDRAGELLVGAAGGVWRCAERACSRLFELEGSQAVEAIASDPRRDELWFGGAFGVVRFRERELERWGPERGLGRAPVAALHVDRRGDLWIRQGDTALRLDTGEGTLDRWEGLPVADATTRLFEDRSGALWSPGRNGLVQRTDEGVWRRFGPADGLPAEAVTALLEDFEGSLWLGFEDDGIARWRGRGQFGAWTRSTGLPADSVCAIGQLADGRLLFGTGAGLAVADRAARTLTTLDARDLAVPSPAVWAVTGEPTGGAFVLLTSGELVHVDGRLRATRIGAASGLAPGAAAIALAIAPSGTIWLGTSRGLYRGSGQGADLRFRLEPTGLDTDPEASTIHDLSFDRDGALWVASNRGLARFAASSWRRFGRQDGLAADGVASVAQAGDGRIWVAYLNGRGVSELTADTTAIEGRLYDRRHGLPLDQSRFVRADPLGRVWIGSARGFAIRAGERFATFDRTDGMRGDDLCANAFHAEADGTVWLGSTRGAISVRLSEQALGAPERPTARIRSASLGDIPFGAGEEPAVSYEQRNFAVGFGARTFLRTPRELEYRFRLSGVDREPVTTTNRSHTYGALSPGRYEFSVEARIRGGMWGEPAKLRFTIQPPWWGTRSAQFAALAAAALFGVLVDRLRGRRAGRRQHELELAVASRTGELKSSREELARKNDELAMQALTDPLTGLKNRRFAWEHVSHEVARIDRECQAAPPGSEPEARVVFFLMDVDLFKSINDRHGHEIGDQILVEAAERVRAATRLSDVAVRWGGEEFLVIASDLPKSEWASYAAKLREAVAKPPYRPSAEVGEVSCTASMGYAAYPFDPAIGIRWQQVLHLADLALYAVKQCGRNADLGVEPGVGWNGSIPVDLLASQMSGALHLRWSSARARRR